MNSLLLPMHLGIMNFVFHVGASSSDIHTSAGNNGKDGIFNTIENGAKNLHNTLLPYVADFAGAVLIIAAVIFACIGGTKSREKSRWFWAAAIALILGSILLVSGAIFGIQDDAGNTWSEVFGK